jgi:hypothetical protein
MSSIFSDAHLQKINLNFTSENRGPKFIITATAKDVIYEANLWAGRGINFDQVLDCLNGMEFEVDSMRNDMLKLSVADLDIEFMNVDKILINELR